ncbi:dioxygenase, partial [Acinetobacter baumannii]
MANFNEHDLTDEVIRSFADTPNKRLKFLIEETVKSLHDLVRRTELTFEEWNQAIEFLTRTGQTCTPLRQEFIL